jgi:hypothetical protein
VFQVLAAAGSSARLKTVAAFAAVAAGATLAIAAPASASVYVKDVASTDASVLGTVDGSSIGDPRFYFGMSPNVVTMTENGRNFDVLAFCVQFYVDMPGSFNAAGTVQHVNTTYEDGDLVTLSNNDLETATKVFNLINYGTDLWLAHSAPDLNIQLASVQGAIWRVMTHQPIVYFNDPDFPDLSVYASKNPVIDHYVSIAGTRPLDSSVVRALVTHGDTAQAIAYSLRTAVPEPATWSMMIVGFFSAGALLRSGRRRRQTA